MTWPSMSYDGARKILLIWSVPDMPEGAVRFYVYNYRDAEKKDEGSDES